MTAGFFRDVFVERYSSHVMISYRDVRRPSIGMLGIELDNGAHGWYAEALQVAACEALGLPRSLAGNIPVVDA